MDEIKRKRPNLPLAYTGGSNTEKRIKRENDLLLGRRFKVDKTDELERRRLNLPLAHVPDSNKIKKIKR